MKAITHYSNQLNNAGALQGNYVQAPALWTRFIAWAAAQEENRFLWVALSLFGHGTVFTIITFMIVLFTGGQFFLLGLTCFTMALVLIVNLAALPTKYTIPAFFLSLLIDFAIIATALLTWFN